MMIFTKEVDTTKPVLEWGEFRDGYDTTKIQDAEGRAFLEGMEYMAEKLDGIFYDGDDLLGCEAPKAFKPILDQLAEEAQEHFCHRAVLELGEAAIWVIENDENYPED